MERSDDASLAEGFSQPRGAARAFSSFRAPAPEGHPAARLAPRCACPSSSSPSRPLPFDSRDLRGAATAGPSGACPCGPRRHSIAGCSRLDSAAPRRPRRARFPQSKHSHQASTGVAGTSLGWAPLVSMSYSVVAQGARSSSEAPGFTAACLRALASLDYKNADKTGGRRMAERICPTCSGLPYPDIARLGETPPKVE